ncbi:MAG TPA: chromosome segregation protein SMC [Candidatus Faecalibacterium gallistercoris]|uniref:Chromosome partition protein Smc n=1 Tax=Candidatus Faecalibacterium gallistercoris TaxID=2838579 RepID=A0A9D2FI95_9FIRM|nr:chromosome segregation protein SMC [Candidatus Faecalibacterium gallistercoris]
MVLKELEIQGFKSFPDKVRITFGRGVTGVVGPNGSGKSNLSDAIRWVLGETSSRQLRSAGKMEDVIFGGTRRRGAMGYASVRLTLDNTDHTLDLDAPEVTIGRRYYRSGDSEYTINGQACRLKDVYELLLDTGIGRDGYSIIGQGRIAEIVAAKGSERREIFEEACGIAKYRYRRTEAEHSLAAAQANLERLRDILGELESRVGPLAREAEKAKAYLELASRRKGLEVTLWVESIRAARAAMQQLQRDYETAQAAFERWDSQDKASQQEAEEIRMQAQRLTVEIERLNGDIRSITEQISGSDSRIAVLENDRVHARQSAESLRAELAAGQTGREAAAAGLERQKAEARELDRRAEALAAEAGGLEQQLAGLQSRTDAASARQAALRARLADVTDRETAARVEEAAARAAAASARGRLPEAQAAARAEQDRLAGLQENLADTGKYLDMLAGSEKQLANVRAGLALKLNSRKKALAAASEAEQELARARDAAAQRLNVLQELEKNMEGYQHSVRAVMQAAAGGRLQGVVGPVSSILTVEAGCELAVETALGAALQNIVVENEAAAKAGIALLRRENAGRATFLPLDTVQPGLFRGELPLQARLASSLVRAEERHQNIVSYLLGRIVVVEDIHAAARVARELHYRNRVVTMDGQVVNAGGSFTGGSVQRSAGLFTRRQEIRELQDKIAGLARDCTAARLRTAQCKSQADAVAAELTAAEGEERTAAGDRVRAEAEGRRLEQAVRQAEEAARQRSAEADALASEAGRQAEAAEKAAEARAALEAEAGALTAELARLTEGGDSFAARQAELADALAQKRMDQLACQKDAELCRSRIADWEQRLADAGAHQDSLAAAIRDLEARDGEILRAIQEVKDQTRRSRDAVREKEAAIQAAAGRRMERQAAETKAQAAARAAAENREDASREMARLSERKSAAEGEYDQLAAKLWDEYQLTPTEAAKFCVEYASLAALRAQVAEVRGKMRALGSVNVGAVEEYQEVRGRYESLKAQVEDVEESRDRLVRMIGELNGQMRDIFRRNFAAINGHFGRVFAELFGGGEASLALEDENDVLNSGIEIRVSPPGKVIKNLEALSGGERALVAISIYFAILAVNPSPFCILDEIEAALDDANVVRFAQYLRRISGKTQFIVITHRRGTMEAADILYGVTMQEDGISKLLRLDLEQVDATLVS